MSENSTDIPPPDVVHAVVSEALVKNQAKLYAVISALTGSSQDAAMDLLQEVNLRILERSAEYDPSRPFWPWAKEFAVRTVREFYTEQQRRKWLVFDSDLMDQLAEKVLDERFERDANAEDYLAKLRECVQKLPPLERQLLAERYENRGKVGEVARKHGITAASLSRMLYKMRKAVELCLGRPQKAEGTEKGDAEGLADILDRFMDGACSADEKQRFQRLLASSPELQTEFLAQEFLHGMMRCHRRYVFTDGKKENELQPPAGKALFRVTVRVAACAAGLALLLAGGVFAGKSLSPKPAKGVLTANLETTPHQTRPPEKPANRLAPATESRGQETPAARKAILRESQQIAATPQTTAPKTLVSAAKRKEEGQMKLSATIPTEKAAVAQKAKVVARATVAAAAILTNAVSMAPLSATGGTYYMTADDASGTSSFNTGANWSSKEAPCAGNTYLVTRTLRCPMPDSQSFATNYVFQGDALVLTNGGSFAWSLLNPISEVTIPNLISYNGTIDCWRDNRYNLYGNLTIPANGSFTLSIGNIDYKGNPTSIWRQYLFYMNISGSGSMAVTSFIRPANFPSVPTFLYGDNSAFTGPVTITGLGRLGVCTETALGTGPSLTFNGMTLYTTNSLSFSNPSRKTVLTGSGIAFEVATGTTNEFSYPISGTGPLVKRGDGVLILSGTNTYAGATTVEAGTLIFASSNALSSGTSVVCSNSANWIVGTVYQEMNVAAGQYYPADINGLDVKNLHVNGIGGFSFDLNDSATETPLIRVADSIDRKPYTVLVCTFTNVPPLSETPYRLLSAPSLAAFKDIDFCVNPPYAGVLSRSTEDSGDILWFTPTPTNKLVYKTSDDYFRVDNLPVLSNVVNDTLWTDGLPASADKTYVSKKYNIIGLGGTFPARFIVFGNNSYYLMPRGVKTTIFPDITLCDSVPVYTWDNGSTIGGLFHAFPVSQSLHNSFVINLDYNKTRINVTADFDGYGPIQIGGNGYVANISTIGIINLTGESTNYFGKVLIQNYWNNSNTLVRIASERTLGGEPPEFDASHLTLLNGFLSVEHDVTIDDANRGIMLQGVGGWLNTENATSTLSIASTIAGTGALRIIGKGTVALSGSNTYSGGTIVTNGSLLAASTNCLGKGAVTVMPQGALVIPYPNDMTQGIVIGGKLTFDSGSHLTLSTTNKLSHSTTIPLFYLPSGHGMTSKDFPFSFKDFKNYKSTIVVEDRQVSVKFSYNGTVVMLM